MKDKPRKRPGRLPKPIPKLAETPEEIAKAIFRAADRKTGSREPDKPIATG